MKILITGAGGATGGSILRGGIFSADEIFYTIHNEKPELNGKSATAILCDLANENDLKKLPQNLDAIIHAAAVVPKKAKSNSEYSSNIKMAYSLKTFIEKSDVKQFIFVSSGSVYGKNTLNKETDICAPGDAYAQSMLEAEKIFLQIKNCTVTIARLFYPFGFDEFTKPDNFIARLFQKSHTGEEIFIAENAHEFFFKPIFINDFTLIIEEILKQPFEGILNIAGSESVTFPQLLEKISNVTSSPMKIQRRKNIPLPFDGDTTLLKKKFPAFQMTPLDEALRITFENLKKARALQ